MNDLEKLGLEYGTDKIGKHNYLPYYFNLFKERRNEVKKVLEIGVGEGASLNMWRDFFPNAMIYGIDNEPKRMLNLDRELVYFGDQKIKGCIENIIDFHIGSNLDLVIDDGSHDPEDQVRSCLEAMLILKKGAIYVIEDVADASVSDLLDMYKFEEIKVGGRYDDRLIVIKK